MIVTGDRDAFQLIDPESRIKVMATARGITETKLYDHQAVIDRYGIPPELIPDFYGLKGDTSDNIPGVPGIGDKTAAQLLQQFGTLEEVLAHVDEISGAKRKENLRQPRRRRARQQAPGDGAARRPGRPRPGDGGGARARPLAPARGLPRVRAARPAAPARGGLRRRRPPRPPPTTARRASRPASARAARRTPRGSATASRRWRSSSTSPEAGEGELFAREERHGASARRAARRSSRASSTSRRSWSPRSASAR